MTKGIISKIINDIGEAQAEARAEDYTMVNVRPGKKVSAMLDILSKLSGKSPSNLVSDEISILLARYAASSIDNADAILDAAEQTLQKFGAYRFQSGSALDLIEKDGIIKVNRQNPYARRLNFSSDPKKSSDV